MLALEYRPTAPGYAAAKVSKRAGLASLRLADLRPPPLVGVDWVVVHPRLSGICGSDHALLEGHASLYLSSLTSTPFVPGHEVVGLAQGGDWHGRRVVVEPALGCEARGVAPACVECDSGRHALCREVTAGTVSAGLQIGFCRQTGGGWSEALVAHRSQLHLVPTPCPTRTPSSPSPSPARSTPSRGPTSTPAPPSPSSAPGRWDC